MTLAADWHVTRGLADPNLRLTGLIQSLLQLVSKATVETG